MTTIQLHLIYVNTSEHKSCKFRLYCKHLKNTKRCETLIIYTSQIKSGISYHISSSYISACICVCLCLCMSYIYVFSLSSLSLYNIYIYIYKMYIYICVCLCVCKLKSLVWNFWFGVADAYTSTHDIIIQIC